MRHLMYAMRFVGRATPMGEVGGMVRTTTIAPSAALHATVGREGLQVTQDSLPGSAATCASEVVFTGNTTFLESGEIHFGDAHRLRFSSLGSGCLSPSADPMLQQGAVIWRIESGHGQFAGASGLICVNLLLGHDGQMVAHHLGVLLMPRAESS